MNTYPATATKATQFSLFDAFNCTKETTPAQPYVMLKTPAPKNIGQPEKQSKKASETTIREAIEVLYSYYPQESQYVIDTDMVIATMKKDEKPTLHYVKNHKSSIKAFCRKVEAHGFKTAKLGTVRHFRTQCERIRYHSKSKTDAANYLTHMGFSVDFSDPADFAPTFPIGACFWVFSPVCHHSYEHQDLSPNQDLDMDFTQGKWKIFQFSEILNLQKGDDVAKLLFSNYTILGANNADEPIIIKKNHFEKLLQLGYAKTATENDLTTYQDFKKSRLVAQYHSNNTILTVYQCGSNFSAYSSNEKFFEKVPKEYLAQEALKIVKQYPDIALSGGEDVLNIANMKHFERDSKDCAIDLLSSRARLFFDYAPSLFLNNCRYEAHDDTHTFAHKLDDFIIRIVEKVETALSDPVSAEKYLSGSLFNNPANTCTRFIFEKIAHVKVSCWNELTQAQKAKWIEIFLVERFGSHALDDVAKAKLAEAECKEKEKIQKAVDSVKYYYSLIEKYHDVLQDLSWYEYQKQCGRVKKWFYGNSSMRLVAHRNFSYRNFHNFMQAAMHTYGSVHRALVALGVKRKDEVDMTRLTYPTPLIMNIDEPCA